MRVLTFVSLFLASTASASAAPGDIDELRASYEFLVRDRADGGVIFRLSAADGGYALPASYRDTAAYWASHVCKIPGNTCDVVDTYNPANYELAPEAGGAGVLQAERVNAHNGANIYDAATWQIAVMLGSVKNRFAVPTEKSAYALASHLNRFLQHSGSQSRASAAPGGKRATTVGNTFTYNGKTISEGRGAYAFRAIAPEYLARDPLMGTPYATFIKAADLPASNPAYGAGKITWSDWKPITGENAWAFLIGPLQAAYIHHVIGEKKPAVPFDDLAIQNALDVLPTFAIMQSAIGAVYYAPTGTVGNQSDRVSPYEVSVENNFSVYAGLLTLRRTLQAQAALSGDDKSKVERALSTIDLMIDGGTRDGSPPTAGLLSFFRNAAWKNGVFVQGGLANSPTQDRDWAPSHRPLPVDVQTWGIAALGATRIDQWFGYGASFDLWQRTKTWGGYGVGKTLWGVGYSDRDGNGIDPAGAYKQGVMSAEWTAGAINAVRNMIITYSAEKPSSSNYAAATKYLAHLRADEAAMLSAIQMLRFDKYQSAAFPGKPDNYAALMSEKTQPYLYASKRFAIPFGWFANPLPSTASTAWILMLANHYDPFGYAGLPN